LALVQVVWQPNPKAVLGCQTICLFCILDSLSFSHSPKNNTIMNKNFFAGLFAGLCLLAIFAFKPAAEKPVEGVQKWEYRHVDVPYGIKMDAKMNDAGQEGWELVTVVGTTVLLFKRPIQ
jgi:hypothetical protein